MLAFTDRGFSAKAKTSRPYFCAPQLLTSGLPNFAVFDAVFLFKIAQNPLPEWMAPQTWEITGVRLR
jgi:hypothetical protein